MIGASILMWISPQCYWILIENNLSTQLFRAVNEISWECTYGRTFLNHFSEQYAEFYFYSHPLVERGDGGAPLIGASDGAGRAGNTPQSHPSSRQKLLQGLVTVKFGAS